MSSRKTINVDALRIAANHQLAASTGSSDERRGTAGLLEHTLHATGNYRGFRYLTREEVPSGEQPGIERPAGPSTTPVFPDESRRHYH